MGKIKALLIILVLFAVVPAAAKDSFMLKLKPPIPGSNPAGINPGCNKCEWDITAGNSEEEQPKHIRAMYLDGKYRLEIKSDDGTQVQVMVFDNAELYILNSYFKTAALYFMAEADNLMFLENVFPGVGLKTKDRTIAGRQKINGRDCDVISYRILKRGKNMFVWATATEWLDRKTGRTIKVETVSDEAMLPFDGKEMTVKPVTQTYTAGKPKKRFFMDKALFKVPQGYKIVDMKKQYEQALEKQKGIKPGKGYEVRKITIPQGKGKK